MKTLGIRRTVFSHGEELNREGESGKQRISAVDAPANAGPYNPQR